VQSIIAGNTSKPNHRNNHLRPHLPRPHRRHPNQARHPPGGSNVVLSKVVELGAQAPHGDDAPDAREDDMRWTAGL